MLINRLPGEGLSSRALDVLRLIAAGKAKLDIAGAPGITESTVKFQVNHVLSNWAS
jgi:DNA-binding NarL/FixJ family response regulator